MKNKIWLIFLIILLLCSCKSIQYKNLMAGIESNPQFHWFDNMEAAEKTIKLMEKAIELKPHKWAPYSMEIQIYASWKLKSEDRSDNQEAVKEVYDRWIANGNSFNKIQEFAYANTLYTLGNYEEANKIYQKNFDYFSANKKKPGAVKDQNEYILYIISGIMLDNINIYNFDEYKLEKFDETGQNEYLLQELQELRQTKSHKKHIAKSLCNC